MRDPNLFRWIVLAGSFSCERIWYNFDRWPCQGEGLVYSRLVANDCITSLLVCVNVKRYAMFVSAFFPDLDIDGRKAVEAIFPTSFIVLIGSCAYWPVLIKRLLTVLWRISSACFEHSPSKFKSAWICGVTLASMSSSKLIPAELALPQASLFFVLPQSGLTLIMESCIQVYNTESCSLSYSYTMLYIPFLTWSLPILSRIPLSWDSVDLKDKHVFAQEVNNIPVAFWLLIFTMSANFNRDCNSMCIRLDGKTGPNHQDWLSVGRHSWWSGWVHLLKSSYVSPIRFLLFPIRLLECSMNDQTAWLDSVRWPVLKGFRIGSMTLWFARKGKL